MYLNVEINLNRDNQGPLYEHVPVYVEIDPAESGMVPGNTTRAYIGIKPVRIKNNGGGDDFSPIAKAGMNYFRLYMSRFLYNPASNSPNPDDQILAMAGFVNEMKILFKGFYKALRSKSHSKIIRPENSWVRLSTPDGKKHGGGVRVSKIEMSDNWANMSGVSGTTHGYGQTYDYTKVLETGETISSGVAAYEPIIGGDENPFRTPIPFSKPLILAADEDYYIEKPIGESFFPAPQIVYSRVQVSSLKDVNVNRHATGHVVHEYYTAKEFPTLVDKTSMDTRLKDPSPILRWLNLKVKEHMTASQGYVIKRNDMHGRPKAQWVYAEGNEQPISGVEYQYRTKAPYQEFTKNELDNEGIQVIHPDGSVSEETIGKEIDLVLDSRESQTDITGIQNQGNVNASLAFLVPFPLPSLFFMPISSQTRFRSVVATKVVDKYGILDRVIAHDLGSKVITQNEAWDAETGQVLLTRTTNEFEDPIYNFSYPAHWAYENMGQAYKNIGATFSSPDFSQIGTLDILQPGDELLLSPISGSSLIGWVLEVNGGQVTLIDESGTNISGTSYASAKVIRSGRRNLQSLSVGSVVSKQSPIQAGQVDWDVNDEVITTGAMAYTDTRKIYGPNVLLADGTSTGCSNATNYPMLSLSNCVGEGEVVNPFVEGIKGSWQADRTYSYLAARDNHDPGSINPSDIRNQGELTTLSPFWNPPQGSATLWDQDANTWTFTEEVSRYSPHGYAVESKNALGIFSSALFAYASEQIPTAIASNSRLNEMANENFEAVEEISTNCIAPHLQLQIRSGVGVLPLTDRLTDQQAHSGNYSVSIGQNEVLYATHLISDNVCDDQGGANPYEADECDFLGVFSPSTLTASNPAEAHPQSYLLSFWLKLSDYDDDQYRIGANNAEDRIEVEIIHCGIPQSLLLRQSLVIEGWQRIEAIAQIPDGAIEGNEFTIAIKGKDGIPDPNYIDDLRIHPFHSSMKTYVYDPANLRLLAVGDENNFMTFYQYDHKGQLVAVKVETEDGIKTLQEARHNAAKLSN
ncbi:MAG: hypothetical protein AAF399_07050 [Bacteroidota bacterium]